MGKTVVKRKHRHFPQTGGELDILDWGYNDFKYIEPIKTPRYINHYSLHFVAKGSGVLEYGGKTYKISEKEIFCLKPDILLAYYPDSTEPWRYFWINFNGEEGKALFSAMGFSTEFPVKKAVNCEHVLATLESMLTKNSSQKETYYKIKSVLYALVSNLCEEKTTESFIKSSDVIDRIKEILRLNYDNTGFSVEVLSDIMHVSHSYICRLFKEQTGQTVIKYLMEYRLDKAAELISSGDYLIKDLASSVGFNDELHFMKEFKKKYGVTVKQYKKEKVNG